MIFNYPYTDLYSLNLDWIIKAIKEVQQVIDDLGSVVNSINGQSGDVVLTDEMLTSILGSVVNSVNGQAGAVVITKDMLTTILEGVVNSFNGRSGTVQLLPADVNATRIDITWSSDPGDTIGSLTQAELDALYADGKRVLIFVNNLGSPDQIYFLTIVGDVVTPQPYTPTATTSGVLSVNGQSGVVTLNADNLPVALGETDTIGDALDSKQAVLTFDNAPTANSVNPVTSGGVYSADQQLGNAITTLAETVNQHSDQIVNLGSGETYSFTGTTAPTNIPANTYFCHNGDLCFTPSLISQGTTIPSGLEVYNGGLNDLFGKMASHPIVNGTQLVSTINLNTLTVVANITLSSGIWVLLGQCEFQYDNVKNVYLLFTYNNDDGLKKIELHGSTSWTTLQVLAFVQTNGETFKLKARYRDGGSTCDIGASITALKIF